MYNIISKSKYAYIFSGILTIFCILAVSIWGLKPSIDFTGGTLMEVKFANQIPAKEELQELLKDQNLGSLTMQASNDNAMLIRYASEDDAVNEAVWKKINEKYQDAKQLRVDFINSTVSKELKQRSYNAIIFAIVAIMAYIAWAFRKVSRPVQSWKYGAGAVIALAHDVLITIGVFSVLGHYYGVEVGIPFIAALLTILGFSVHDTIVVYDRTRENMLRTVRKDEFPEVVNRSLNETMVRSINTSLTVIITLLAIYLFGGESIKDFALALLIGITFGTYSSIFIASSFLVSCFNWSQRKKK